MTKLPERILCLDLRKRRFGFAVLEGPHKLLDWGTRDLAACGSAHAKRIVQRIVDAWKPDKLIVGAPRDEGGLPGGFIKDAVEQVSSNSSLPLRHIRRKEMRAVFNAANKTLTARAISFHFAELEPRLPDHPRRLYDNEPASMTIFDAVALGLAYFRRKMR